tara:strand:+ start:4764 stop:4961 length:198 start_codon:yes stop_codon:yes gene_type:complete
MDMFQEIKEAFSEQQEKLKVLLATGQVEDYNQYKQLVGTISGIEWASVELGRIINNRMEREDSYD